MTQSYQFAEINGTKMHYDMRGTGQGVVLIHSGVADLRFWDDQINVFAEKYRVVRYDVRGHGQTPEPPGTYAYHEDLRALLDHLGIERAVLVGCSMGGGLAIDFALAYPARTTALIPVAPGVSGYEPEITDLDAKAWQEKLYAEIETAYEAGNLAYAAELEARVWMDGPQRTPNQVDPTVRARAVEMLLTLFEMPVDVGERQELEPPAATRLAEIKVPTLAIVGDYDLEPLINTVDYIAENVSGTQKVTMQGVAHYPNMEKPEEFNRLVLGFLHSLELKP